MRWLRQYRGAAARVVAASLLVLAIGGGWLAWKTARAMHPLPHVLPPVGAAIDRAQVVDRHGDALSITYQNRWNVHDLVPLHRVPQRLIDAFLAAEDQRFYRHRGVDWLARTHAMMQNLRALRPVRGASTISEQAVRILYPRPRTPRSRWLESFEVKQLEARFTKAEILELYLNQVPYARQRRGVAQAARTWFDRDLDTLSAKETLALAVLVRSPSRLDPAAHPGRIEAPILRLAERMHDREQLPSDELEAIRRQPLEVREPSLAVRAGHFVRYVREHEDGRAATVRTTLDGALHGRVQQLLDQRIAALSDRGATSGAVLVVDHTTDEILAWVNSGGLAADDGGQIDKVRTLRQPGSTLKPFVYARALEDGWTAATVVDDSPLADPVGHGMHAYRNYSRSFYGPVRVRQALASSLNIPAVRAAREVGSDRLLEQLRQLGFDALDRHPEHYGDGLALGSGEVDLLSLVGAYATIARGGVRRPLRWRLDDDRYAAGDRVMSAPVASLIADILSDPEARSLEFGRDSVLRLPQQTAVKTGTSSDYRDAWTVGFSHRYTVGVWMGDLDRQPMDKITGSVGPALVLRAVFADLDRRTPSAPLALDRRLVRHKICSRSGAVPTAACPLTEEWFRSGMAPSEPCSLHAEALVPDNPAMDLRLRLESPTPGLHLAMDPRIPDDLEAFPLQVELDGHAAIERVEWIVDEQRVATTGADEPSDASSWLWPVTPGRHTARARAWTRAGDIVDSQTVGFLVK